MIPKNCHLWQKENITSVDFDFENVKNYWDYSHEWRDLVKCKKCGQLYICDSKEFFAWDTGPGKDEIYTIIIPVSEEDLEKYNFNKISSLELFVFFPHIYQWGIDSMCWKGKDEKLLNDLEQRGFQIDKLSPIQFFVFYYFQEIEILSGQKENKE